MVWASVRVARRGIGVPWAWELWWDLARMRLGLAREADSAGHRLASMVGLGRDWDRRVDYSSHRGDRVGLHCSRLAGVGSLGRIAQRGHTSCPRSLPSTVTDD